MLVYEEMGAALAAAGVDRVFSLLGEGILWLADSLVADHGVEVVPAWSDNLAVAMADGYARSSDQVGVAALTVGPGLTSAITSLVVAHKHRTALVLVVGASPTTSGYHNQRVDQRALVESLGIEYQEVTRPEGAADLLRDCLNRARADRHPIVLAVPADLQRAEVGAPAARTDDVTAPAHREPATAAPGAVLDRLAALLRGSTRTLLLAGHGAVRSGALTDIESLAEATGALLGTSLRAKGAFEGHRSSVGLVGGFADDDVRDLLADAELVIAFGARFGHYTSSWGEIAPRAEIVRVVDVRPGDIDGAPVTGLVVEGDARAVAADLAGRDWSVRPATGWQPPEPTDWAATEPAGLHSYSATRTLNAHLPADARLVLGVGHFWSIVATELRGVAPGRFVFEDDFTAIGQAMAMACGTAIAHPGDRVYLVDGDGSMLFNPAALRTVGDRQLPICTLILNDGAYAAEVHALESDGRSGDVAAYPPFGFGALAEAYGVTGRTCRSVADLADGLRSFAADPRPLLLDVRVDPAVISRTYRRTRYQQRV